MKALFKAHNFISTERFHFLSLIQIVHTQFALYRQKHFNCQNILNRKLKYIRRFRRVFLHFHVALLLVDTSCKPYAVERRDLATEPSQRQNKTE